MIACTSKDIPADVPKPLGRYQAVTVRGDWGCVSGQFPVRNGGLAYVGRVGEALSIEDGQAAARLCALNALGQMRQVLANGFDTIELLRIEGYIAAGPTFLEHPLVLDGASDALVQILGERGAHARVVIPVPRLPRNAPVEIAVMFRTHQGNDRLPCP